ncbi:hypothetical protein QBC43DRAFT_306359 [Cladorrhinum sp. PSN259]|nr:hypothetical protein QBC43DRAFT_306359 [Cladorrhinum sp. PSN259]
MALKYPATQLPSSSLAANAQQATPTPANPNCPPALNAAPGLPADLSPPRRLLAPRRPTTEASSSSISSWSSTSCETLDDEESFVFRVEKGFWKVKHGARELLRFADLFNEHKSVMSDTGRSSPRPLPKEIDLISMTQLSYSVLHAVSDINTHSQRAIDERRLPSRENRVTKRSSRSKKRKVSSLYPATTTRTPTEITCEECFCTNTPQWRNDSTGRVLCNFCGLIYAKRCQMYGSRHVR